MVGEPDSFVAQRADTRPSQDIVAGKLLEPRDVDALGDAARDRATPEAVAGKPRRVQPGEAGPILDNQRDRIGVDRVGTNPVAVGYRLSLSAPRNTRRWQAPDPPEQRAFTDRRGGEPGLERRDRTEIGAPLRQPQPGAAGILIVLAPRQEQLDAVGMTHDMREREPGNLARPQRRDKADEQQGPVAQSGQRLRNRRIVARSRSSTSAVFLLSGRRWARLMPANVVETTASAVGGG